MNNKKVYVVTDGDYSDYRIIAIFSNEKEAERYSNIHNYNGVDEMEVYDSCKQKTDKNERWVYAGRDENIRIEETDYQKRYRILLFQYFNYFIYRNHDIEIKVYFQDNNYTEEEALKVAKDYYVIAYNELMEANFPKDEKLLKMIEDKLNSRGD